MRNRLCFLASVIAVAVMAAALPTDLVAGTCDIPLPIVKTVGEAKVLIVLDTSGSMNIPVYADGYDYAVTYPGNFDAGATYYVSSDGIYTPKSFRSTWPAIPTAYLVNSDAGQDGWYPGNYMNWIYFNATAAQVAAIPRVTRIQVAKAVVDDVVAGGTSNTSFGVMVFNPGGGNGGTMLATIGTPTATIQSRVNAIGATSWTPLAETMVDAMTYFQSTGAGAPLQASCEKAFVIVVTDGLPTQDLNVPSYLQDANGDGKDPGNCTTLGTGYPDFYNCSDYLDDVAYYMYRNDMRSDLSGQQNVTTYVVGFAINAPILQATADQGGGTLYTANNAAQLAATLGQALADVDKKVAAGSAVSVVSAENQTNNRLYRARFESVSWKGFVEALALPYHTGDTPVWEAGALLQSRTPDSRTIYTSSTGTNTLNFNVANAATLMPLLGAADVASATTMIQYARGTDIAGYRNRSGWKLGDIVDSSPIDVGKPSSFYEFLSYPSFRSANLSRPEMLYVGANDGMLHAFNASDGSEAWAYVPKNQLSKLQNLMSVGYCHNYFVNMTPAIYDIYMGGAWKTVLIGGEERGGSGLFALDVTDPTPGHVSVLWDVDLPTLKGSWNRPALVRDRTLDKFVLCASTGLDSLTGTASLLVLDPANGSILSTYALGTAGTVNMATAPTALDKNFDGYDDLMYVGDLLGRVWHVDLTANPWTVTQLFSNSQPIQAAPLLSMDEQGRVLVYFGTGKYVTTADLSTTTSQSIYGLFDNGSGTLLTRANLINQTSTITALSAADKGWYVDLVQHTGERVTRSGALVGGALYFPSFRPKNGSCESGGESWVYSLDFGDGSAPDLRSGAENNTTTGRVTSMGDGILSNPAVDLVNQVIIMQNSNTDVLTQNINVNVQKLMVRSWRQKWD